MSETPRIYVACLASYNAGILHGEWIDADQTAEVIHEAIQEMLSQSSEPIAEEWAIHDYEGFAGVDLSEYQDIETVAKLAGLIAEHGEAFAAYAEHVGIDYATADGFEDAYRGEWESETDYAETTFDDLYAHDVPVSLRCYIDYEKFARDLFINDMTSVQGECGCVYVFDRL